MGQHESDRAADRQAQRGQANGAREATEGLTGGAYPRRLLRVSEAAQLLGVCRQYLYVLIARGELPVVRLGQRATRVRPEDVERLIERKLTGTLA